MEVLKKEMRVVGVFVEGKKRVGWGGGWFDER